MTRVPYRILHIIDSLDGGGAELVVLNLVKFADRSRFDPEVAALHGQGVYYDRMKALGVRVHSLSPWKSVPLYIPRTAWLSLCRRYDLMHFHLGGANGIAKPVAAICGTRHRFYHDHSRGGLRLTSRLRYWMDWATIGLSTQIIAVSQSTRDFEIEALGAPPGRIEVIPNGIDIALFRDAPARREALRREWGIPQGAFVAGGVGRLVGCKNFPLFLRVAARVTARHPDAMFVLAGRGAEEAPLRELARELNLGERFRFLGYVNTVEKLWPMLDAHMITSNQEGTPMTMLEAMAARVPNISSAIDGMAEILEHDVDALLAAPRDEDAFVRHVEALVTQPALRRRLAEAAARKVERDYSAEGMARRVERLYLNSLEPSGAAG